MTLVAKGPDAANVGAFQVQSIPRRNGPLIAPIAPWSKAPIEAPSSIRPRFLWAAAPQPNDPATRFLMRRYGLSRGHARTVVTLSGLGGVQ